MLYRFRQAQAEELGLFQPVEARPTKIEEIWDIVKAEKWRGEVINDISTAVSKIQDG